MLYKKEIKTNIQEVREIAQLVGEKFDAKHIQEIRISIQSNGEVRVDIIGLDID